MSHSAIQDRLRDHAKAFDGLLSLIPAKIYYGEDNSSQWNKKKQTKAEAAAARRGKLDPDSELNRNAKEVMDQRAKSKPKSELQDDGSAPGGGEGGDGHLDGMAGITKETPGQGLKRKAAATTTEPKKKRKVDRELSGNDVVNPEGEVQGETGDHLSVSCEKNAAGGERKKRARKRSRREPKGAGREKTDAAETEAGDAASNLTLMAEPSSSAPKHPTSVRDPASKPGADKPNRRKLAAASEPDELSPDKPSPDGTGLPKHGAPDEQPTRAASDPGRAQVPSILDEQQSADQANPATAFPDLLSNGHASPAAGLPEAPVSAASEEKPRLLKIPADTSALRARLTAKIEALRAARKADGTDGRPIRTRQELIESRRAKQAQLKAHKKELRRQAKLEEDRHREEALASNSPMSGSPSLGPDQEDETAANFSFNRVAFSDGTRLSHDLSYALNRDGAAAAKKGPSDPKTALLKIQNQKKRLDGLDEEKRKEIGEKEAWLTARRRAEGAKIHDDEAMLKKVVKRKEHAKKKTEREWKERSRGVDHAMKERQRKRDDNLQKRKDEKALGKMGRGKAKGGKPAKKGGRPGFEGGFKFGASKKK